MSSVTFVLFSGLGRRIGALEISNIIIIPKMRKREKGGGGGGPIYKRNMKRVVAADLVKDHSKCRD